jgi:hypothetical protein
LRSRFRSWDCNSKVDRPTGDDDALLPDANAHPIAPEQPIESFTSVITLGA